MSTAVKSRRAARGWVTRASKILLDLCKKESKAGKDLNVTEMEDAMDEFDKRLAKLDCVQSEVELEIDEDKLLMDIEEAADFREKSRVPRLSAAKILADRQSHEEASALSVSNQSHSQVAAKLPKIELSHFKGDPLQWTSFWEQFEVIVHNSDMPDVTKFTYLRSLLEGEALATVQGLSLNAPHYKVACDLLEKRYGRPEKIIFSHVQELLNITLPKQAKIPVLWTMYNDLQSHVRSLEALGVSGAQYGVVLTPLILSRLPSEMRLEWARLGESHEGDLPFLLDFLQEEIERRERSQTFNVTSCGGEEKKSGASAAQPTAAALHTSTEEQNCPICKRGNHNVQRCYSLTKAPVRDRRDILKSAKVCFRCLSRRHDHNFKACQARCGTCKGHHHALLCERHDSKVAGNRPVDSHGKNEPKNVSQGNGNNSHVGLSCASKTTVFLQTTKVNIRGTHGSTEAVVLFDTGSDKTYISQSVVDKIGPEWVSGDVVSFAAFGSAGASKAELRNVYNVNLLGVSGKSVNVLATAMPVICSPLYCPSIPQDVLSALGEHCEVVSAGSGQEVVIDMLIGLDFYWKLMTPEIVSLPRGLVAQRTELGWVISGSMSSREGSPGVVSHQLFCVSGFSEADVRSFWDLESIGVCSKEEPVVDHVLEEFQETVALKDGRYEVALPWKPESVRPKLLDNEKLARQRLEHLTRRLARSPELEVRYHSVIDGYLQQGFIEEVPHGEPPDSGAVYYMPHRPVVKESNLTTKVRPVYDASAKGFNGVSLNDCMEAGPSLIPNLPGILLRFRRWKVALTADVTKAFLQIQIRPQDRDVHRFLWNDGGTVRVMRFLRLPFGNKSSPFLMNATVKYHLSQCPPSRVVEELSENLYVDNFLSGCDDDSVGCDLLQEANRVMQQAGMTLSQWASNSGQVGVVLNRELHDRSAGEESLKVLGLRWQAADDFLHYDGVAVPEDLCITKRVVLSFIARMYDPLGYLTPFVMVAKRLFQELWRQGLGWDEVVPVKVGLLFRSWLDGLDAIRQWKIPRCYTGGRWSDVQMIQLHAFGDASQAAYGACVYLRVLLPDSRWRSSLVYSKARVAPLKRVTLPRLELLAALLCARLLEFVIEALKLPASVSYSCWSDSMVALAWIQSDPARWKPFVGNRVLEIQKLTCPSRWHYCPTKLNPSDLVTRGISGEELVSSELWLHGPEFLSHGDVEPVVETTPSVAGGLSGSKELCEAVTDSVLLTAGNKSGPVLACERWSGFTRAIRVVGWIIRFKANLRCSKNGRQAGDLTYRELCQAKILLLCSVQHQVFSEEFASLSAGESVSRRSSIYKLTPFLGEHGLIRVQGRLQFSGLSEDAKHPIILPRCHLSLLLARHIHKTMKHAGVNTMLVNLRDHYWIISARRLCKAVKKECVSCQRLDAPAGHQTMAPLPELRVTRAPPFSVTGLDHGGPLYCCDFVGRKFYILLFTCAVIRAVHLELVDSLSCETTMMALRRFMARRGVPSVLMSDNAKGFVAARDQLLQTYGSDGPRWQFIAPRAPWWGGWWERLIGSVKSALKRSLGKKSLTRVELETTLHEVEACVNSRPLTFIGDELDSGDPLTPSHFLLGRTPNSTPVVESENPVVKSEDLALRQQLRRQQMDRFWSCWSNEYIRGLPPCKGSSVNQGGVHEGSVVLVQDVSSGRMQWPMGIVTKIHQGKDGLVRAVDVRTAKSVLTRPVQRVHDLELVQCSHDASPTSITPESKGQASTKSETLGVKTGDTSECSGSTHDESQNVDIENTMDTQNIGDSIPDMTCAADTLSDMTRVSDKTTQRSTRCGRAVKPVLRLDL